MNLLDVLELHANRKLQGRTVFQGIPISIENKKGSVREGTSPEWGPWRTVMKRPYGYIRGTKKLGMDGAELDVFLGPKPDAKFAYLIMIKKAPDFQKDDELKIMLGYDSACAAKKSLLQHFDDTRFFGRIRTVPMQELREMVGGEVKEKLAADVGEPGVYDGGYGHIEPRPSFHPPSMRKPKRVPTDDPKEDDDTFMDVTKRKAKATKDRRDSLTRQHTDANMKPLNTQLVPGFPSVTVGGFG